jgi:hypothetical protein
MCGGIWKRGVDALAPRQAIAKVAEIHGFNSEDACIKYLEQQRRRLRARVASDPYPSLRSPDRDLLEMLDELPTRRRRT